MTAVRRYGEERRDTGALSDPEALLTVRLGEEALLRWLPPIALRDATGKAL